MQQIRDFTAALKEAYARVDPELVVPYYVTVPPHPSLQFSSRRRFAVSDGRFSFMRREQSVLYAAELLQQLGRCEPGAYFQGLQGAGMSHLIFDIFLLLCARADCRVVYQHDCASWADYRDDLISATLYFLRSVAMAFADDDDVLSLCRTTINEVAICSSIQEAERIVCSVFLPQLGDLCRQDDRKVFFVFDQHNSLTPELRSTFPYSLPEARLLRIPQLRGVGMVVISASANNEYQLKVALQQPPLPTFQINRGFLTDGEPSEVATFLEHHGVVLQSPEVTQLQYETNCFPLELAYFVQTRNLLRTAKVDHTFESVLNTYLNGRDLPLVKGRHSYFALAVRDFDQKIASQPRTDLTREHLINGIVCMQLQLPISSFSNQVFLNRQLCFMSDRPFGGASVDAARGLDFIHPITPLARTAAVNFYLASPAYVQTLQSASRHVFAMPTLESSVRGFILQRYIIQRLREASSFELAGQKIGDDHSLSPVATFCSIRLPLSVTEWYGLDVPPTTLSRPEDLLLVPLSVNYPGVNFLIWIAGAETLFLFHVTVTSVAKHTFWESQQPLEAAWVAKLGVKKMERVWISPDVNAGTPRATRRHSGQWACSLALLKRTNSGVFPLLQSWLPAL